MKSLDVALLRREIAQLRAEGKTSTGVSLDDLDLLAEDVALGRYATAHAAGVLDYCRVVLVDALTFISKPKNRLPIQTAIAKIDELLEVPEEEAIDEAEAARRRARAMLVLPPEFKA